MNTDIVLDELVQRITPFVLMEKELRTDDDSRAHALNIRWFLDTFPSSSIDYKFELFNQVVIAILIEHGVIADHVPDTKIQGGSSD